MPEPVRDNAKQDLSKEALPKFERGSLIDLIDFKQKTKFYKGVKFDSKSEIICVKLMEAFVPKWELKVGETYSVHIGHGKYCDFRINDTLIEYHPIVLPRELSKASYKMLSHAFRGMAKGSKEKIQRALKHHCREEYLRKRKFSVRVNHDTDIQECDLILCDSPSEFYDLVLKEFGKNLPSKDKVLQIFPRH